MNIMNILSDLISTYVEKKNAKIDHCGSFLRIIRIHTRQKRQTQTDCETTVHLEHRKKKKALT